LNYVIADHKPERYRAFQSALKNYPDLHFRGSFANEQALLAEVFRSAPDIVFIYIGDKEFNAFSVVQPIRSRAQDTRIVFVSEKSDYALPAFEIGVDNYLLLPPDEVRLHNMLHNLEKIR
jgi:DNA-binding LytR/AlgR family response regulator